MSWATRFHRLSDRMGRAAPLAAIGLTLALCGAVSWTYSRSTEKVRASREQLAECRKLANEIRRLEAVPAFAAIDADSQRSIAGRIQSALHQAKLTEDAVLRIRPPAQPLRLGDTPYEIYSTRIELKQVTLSQLTEFAYYLNDSERGLTVQDLRLWTPQRDSSPVRETWSVEITLTQLAFSPKTR